MSSEAISLPLELMGDHQIASDINLPTESDLLKKVLSEDQLAAIYKAIGRKKLERLASVVHGNDPNPDYRALAEREGQDLEVIFQAVREVTGKSKPWITGFASEFAQGLMEYIDSL